MSESQQQSGFAIEQAWEGERCRLMLHGELDLATASVLEAEIRDVQARGVKELMLDLSDLQFMDSTGLTILVREHQAADMNGHTISLRGRTPQVHRLFELTGTLGRFTFDDPESEELQHDRFLEASDR
jgi:anti-sigma B factor antagonist